MAHSLATTAVLRPASDIPATVHDVEVFVFGATIRAGYTRGSWPSNRARQAPCLPPGCRSRSPSGLTDTRAISPPLSSPSIDNDKTAQHHPAPTLSRTDQCPHLHTGHRRLQRSLDDSGGTPSIGISDRLQDSTPRARPPTEQEPLAQVVRNPWSLEARDERLNPSRNFIPPEAAAISPRYRNQVSCRLTARPSNWQSVAMCTPVSGFGKGSMNHTANYRTLTDS